MPALPAGVLDYRAQTRCQGFALRLLHRWPSTSPPGPEQARTLPRTHYLRRATPPEAAGRIPADADRDRVEVAPARLRGGENGSAAKPGPEWKPRLCWCRRPKVESGDKTPMLKARFVRFARPRHARAGP